MPDDRAFHLDPAVFSVALAATLRRAGIPSSPERAVWFVDALRLTPPRSRSQLYWTSRAVFVTSQTQLDRFDAVFAAIFDGMTDIADARGDPNAPDPASLRRSPSLADPRAPEVQRAAHDPVSPSPAGADSSDDGDTGNDADDDVDERAEAIVLAASREERLHTTEFAALQADELARIRRLVAELAVATPLRQGRRDQRSLRSHDRLDMRRTVRSARRTGGDALRLQHVAARKRPRSLVLLCDVSASMDPYTRVFLALMQAAVVTTGAEAFVFATRLTRLTRQLAVRDPDRALESAAGGATDWAGGTRLAEGIRAFIDGHGRRGVARGAVVVILSDGWAQDDPADIERQMARLSRLAHRIVWVNPRKAAAGFEPLTGGMAAALPYCDAFVSGHSYRALQDLVRVIADDSDPISRKYRREG